MPVTPLCVHLIILISLQLEVYLIESDQGVVFKSNSDQYRQTLWYSVIAPTESLLTTFVSFRSYVLSRQSQLGNHVCF